MPKFGTKMPYMGIFGLEFFKTIVIFEITTLEFVIYESLTHTMNFGMGFAFSKGPRSAFSEGPGWVRVRFIKYALINNIKEQMCSHKL